MMNSVVMMYAYGRVAHQTGEAEKCELQHKSQLFLELSVGRAEIMENYP